MPTARPPQDPSPPRAQIGMLALRGYLVIAALLVLIKAIQLCTL
jgi:hypothetical protein